MGRTSKTAPKARRAGKKLVRTARGATQTAVAQATQPTARRPFPVVGVGASAGGLEAFTALLKALPNDTGMAFVLVQHMEPAHESALSRILSGATGMPVNEVTDGTSVQPNHVYVIPSNADMTIRDGILRLVERQKIAGRHFSIDRFLVSLAEDRKSAAIGVILSGGASDGTQGLKAIRAEGGLTFAQDEKSARYTGMPLSAVAAGCVDIVLPPERIAAELARMSRHPYIGISRSAAAAQLAGGASAFRRICKVLRSTKGVDFHQYEPTILRHRIARRMVVQGVETPEKYLQLLHNYPGEREALYQDILARVTGFFRDPEAFQALQTKVLFKIASRKPRGAPVRAWVPGCSTGEEAYSVAILMLETLGEPAGRTRIQVFGTDISEQAIQQARGGTYQEGSLANVSPERLKRFFVQVEGGYQISKPVREICVFARHDLTRDPPFLNLDLISCRNVLLNMEVALQQRTIEEFHYALRPGEYLLLGKSDSLGSCTSLFAPAVPKHNIFLRKAVANPRLERPTTGDKLKAAKAEFLSATEQFHSINEELETAKEELQSSNEELTTLNEELQNRNDELGQLTNDLSNLLVGVNIPVVILDNTLRIRRFTPAAEKIWNLIPADVGRPFAQIASNLVVTDWDQSFSEVLDHLRAVDREVQDRQGHWYALRIRPYKTGENRIDGVLMALLDIDLVKRSLEQVRQARDYAEAIVETISETLLVLDGETRVLAANAGFYKAFRTSPGETLGKLLFELGAGQWNIPRLRQLLIDLLPEDTRIENFAVEHDFPGLGHRHMVLNARQMHRAGAGTGMILLAIRDVTEAVEVRRLIEESEAASRALLESATQSILAVDRNGTIRLANRTTEAMFGYSQDEVLGQPLAKLLPERLRERHNVHLAGFFAAPRTRPMGAGLDLVGRRKDGAEFPIEVSLSHIETKAGTPAVCFVSDISERRQNEAVALQYQQELRALTAKLISAQEASSKHLARELHDVFSQKLAVLGLEITAVEQHPSESAEARGKRLRQIAKQIGALAADIHQVSRQLHPAILDDLGLVAALNGECLAFSEQHSIAVKFTAQNVEEPLAEDISLCLYRVAQESLRNIVKHAGGTAVRVDLTGGRGEIALVIEDVGEGFELDAVRGKGGLGLVSMDERVRLVGGTFSIQSEPGGGTRVAVRVPLG